MFRKCPNNGTPFRDPCQTIAPDYIINRSKPEEKIRDERSTNLCRVAKLSWRQGRGEENRCNCLIRVIHRDSITVAKRALEIFTCLSFA